MQSKIAKFQVETLEQRFEMGWIEKVGYEVKTSHGTIKGEIKTK
jgi:hypothetical protein